MVQISIGADPSGVRAAFAQIEAAIQRAGQAGVAFSKLDLSHPELAQFANDIRTVQQRLGQLASVGAGQTAAAVRSFTTPGAGTNVFGPAGLATGGLNARYPSPVQANRVLAQAGAYAFQGTRWQQQTQPPPAAPPGPGGGGGGGGPRLPPGVAAAFSNMGGGGAGPGALSTLGPLLAGAGIGSIGVMLANAIRNGQQENILLDTLMRRMNDVGSSFDAFRTGLSNATKGLGITTMEATKLATTWSRMTGETGEGAVTAGMRLGAGFGRGAGIEPEAATAMLGRAQFLGQDPGRFALLLADAMQRGGQEGQGEQVGASMMKALESASARLMDSPAISGTLTAFTDLYTRMNASGMPGLRGEHASAIIDQMNSSVMQGGNAGMAGQVLTMRALNAQGITNPYQIEGIRQRGMFARIGRNAEGEEDPNSPTNMQAILGEINREYGGLQKTDPFRYRHIIQQYFGTQQPVVEGLQKTFGNDLSGMAGGGINPTLQRLQQANIDLTKLNPESVGDVVGIAAGNDLEKYRTRLLNRTGTGELTEPERTSLQATAPEDLQAKLLQLYAGRGAEETEGSRQRQVMADLTNALTNLGIRLGPPMVDLTKMVTSLVDEISPLIKWLSETKVPDWMLGGGATKDLAQKAAEGLNALDGTPGNPSAYDRLTGTGQAAPGGGGGPRESVTPLTDAAQKDAIRRAMDHFQSPEGGGYTHAQSAGIVANLMGESGMNPKAKGDYDKQGNATSFGMAQWHAERVKLVEDHFGKKITDMTEAEQLQAVTWEMANSQQGADRALRATTTAGTAGYSVTRNYENPANGFWTGVGRGQNAAAIDRNFPGIGEMPKLQPAAAAAGAPITVTLPSPATAPLDPNFPTAGEMPPMPPPAAAAPASVGGGEGGTLGTIRAAPMTVTLQTTDGRQLDQKTLPMFVIPPTPNNAPNASPTAAPVTTQPGPGSAPAQTPPPMPPPPAFDPMSINGGLASIP